MRICLLPLGFSYLWFRAKALQLDIGVSTVNRIIDEAA